MALTYHSLSVEDVKFDYNDRFVPIMWVGPKAFVNRTYVRRSISLATLWEVRPSSARFILAYRDVDTFGKTIYALDLEAVIWDGALKCYLRNSKSFEDLDVAIMECVMICNMNLKPEP